ncbi:MAG: hypothetical protein A2341_17710 [Deltaproteobacteria bacterium RIFOXYB12_FULL_58_9]|nr:MAG: hypothetical protein A2341_17710 [Deltaproteobacteria bacterium RIFOXYB12_FULL_58_9]
MRGTFEEVVVQTDRVCSKHLNEEYCQLSRELTATLCRKRPSPLEKGKITTWACAVVYTLGFVNFLFDEASSPFLSRGDLCKLFRTAPSTASARATEIKKLLDIGQLEPRWCLPSKLDSNPLAWMIEVDGFVLDARQAPRQIQELASQKGLIPYLPQ